MKKLFRKILITAIIFVMILTTVCFAVEFTDMAGHWAYDDVQKLVGLEIVNGYPDGTYRPETAMTREQFAKILVETLDLNESSKIKFSDVEDDRWSLNYINSAATYIEYSDANEEKYFTPDLKISREIVASAIVKAMNLDNEMIETDEILKNFKDASEISINKKEYVAVAIKYKLMQGNDQAFYPKDYLTRAEVATLMCNVLEVKENLAKETDKKLLGNGYGIVKKIDYDAVNEKYSITMQDENGDEFNASFSNNLLEKEDFIRWTLKENKKIRLGRVAKLSDVINAETVTVVSDDKRMANTNLGTIDLDDENGFKDMYEDYEAILATIDYEDDEFIFSKFETSDYQELKLNKEDRICINENEEVILIGRLTSIAKKSL